MDLDNDQFTGQRNGLCSISDFLMLVPTLTQYRPDMLDDLTFLFKVCGWEFDPAQPPDSNNSIVALYKGQLVGFVTYWLDSQPYAFVDSLLVHPDFRSKGIGYYLAHAVKEIVLKHGASAIRFVVTNPELAATLDRVGCTRREDAVVMEWKNGRVPVR
mgnify:CR=1 FL=1